jgi:ParB family chromosome partitioning protein
MARKPALGRGISALIPDAAADEAAATGQQILQIGVDEIDPNPFQPRAAFAPEQLGELMRSIQEKGVIQPVTVNRVGMRYQLIAGERRWRASKLAGLKTIPAIVHQVESQQDLMELSLIENIQREDLNPIEEAEGYRSLIDTCFLTQDEVARKVGKDRSTVANMVRLLRLPEPVQDCLRRGQLQMGHARALLALEEDDERVQLAQRAVAEGMTVRQVEQAVQGRAAPGRTRRPDPDAGQDGRKPPAPARHDPHLTDFEERLQHRFGTAVAIRGGAGAKGRIELEYYDADDLERLLELLLGDAG